MIDGDMNIKLPNQLTIPANRAAASGNSRAGWNGPTKWCKTKRPWLLWHQRQFPYLNPNGTAWIQVVRCWCSNSIKFAQRLGLFISIPYMSIHFHVAAPLAVLWLVLLFTRAPALTAKGDQPGGSMFEAEKKVRAQQTVSFKHYSDIYVDILWSCESSVCSQIFQIEPPH